ncbi:MAG: enoyl-CoA hydratase/isomerase family protein [Mycobacteriales bacterium]
MSGTTAGGAYRGLTLERRADGVAVLTIVGRDRVNSLDEQDHAELAAVWPHLEADPRIRVTVVTGAGNVFSAGGNLAMEQRVAGDYGAITRLVQETRDLVVNIVNCNKPIISAINGPAAGAGLAVALLADISIIGDDVQLTDGHTRIGLAAGDHAALIWPLLCGMARAKYYLLTCDRITGGEAAQIGLVSRSVSRAAVFSEALAVATRLAAGPQLALQWTKRSLNHWLRDAGPTFEASLGLEMINMFGPEYREGLDAFLNHREPRFDSAIEQAWNEQ